MKQEINARRKPGREEKEGEGGSREKGRVEQRNAVGSEKTRMKMRAKEKKEGKKKG